MTDLIQIFKAGTMKTDCTYVWRGQNIWNCEYAEIDKPNHTIYMWIIISGIRIETGRLTYNSDTVIEDNRTVVR